MPLTGKDTLTARQLKKRMDYLDMVRVNPRREMTREDMEELEQLTSIHAELDFSALDEDTMFIKDDFFENYVRDLIAEYIPKWVAGILHIDWKKTATTLQQDYGIVPYGDNDYYYHNH